MRVNCEHSFRARGSRPILHRFYDTLLSQALVFSLIIFSLHCRLYCFGFIPSLISKLMNFTIIRRLIKPETLLNDILTYEFLYANWCVLQQDVPVIKVRECVLKICAFYKFMLLQIGVYLNIKLFLFIYLLSSEMLPQMLYLIGMFLFIFTFIYSLHLVV